MDSSTVQYMRCFDKNNVIKFLRDKNYIDVAAILKQKDIDGRRFLELTELDLVQWRLTPKQKKMILNCRDQIANEHFDKKKEKPTVPKKPPHVTSRVNSKAKIFQELENKLNIKQTEEIQKSNNCSTLDEYVDMTSKLLQTQQQSQRTNPQSAGNPGQRSLPKVPAQNINKQTKPDFRNKSVVPEKPAKNTNKEIRTLFNVPSQLHNHIHKQNKSIPLDSDSKFVKDQEVSDELYEEPNQATNSNTFSLNRTRRLPETNQKDFSDNDEGYVILARESGYLPPKPFPSSHQGGVISKSKKETSHNFPPNVTMGLPNLSVAKQIKTYSESIYEDEPKLVPPGQEFRNHKYTPGIPPRPAEVSHDTGSMRPPSLSAAKELKTYSESIYEDEPKLVLPVQQFRNHKYKPGIPSRPAEVSHNTGSIKPRASNESDWAKRILPLPPNIQTAASPVAEQNVAKELKTCSEDIYEDEPKLVPHAQEFHNHKLTPDVWPCTAEVSHDIGSIKPRASNETDWAKRKLPLPPNIQNAASPFAEQNALPKPPQFQKKFEKSQLCLVKTLMEEETEGELDSKKEFNPNDCQFYRNTDRKGAKQLLLKIPNLADGAFVLRQSDGYFLALTIYYQNHFYNVGIYRHEDGSFYCKTENGGHALLFKTLEEFIEYYKMYPITLKAKETHINICLKELLPLDIY